MSTRRRSIWVGLLGVVLMVVTACSTGSGDTTQPQSDATQPPETTAASPTTAPPDEDTATTMSDDTETTGGSEVLLDDEYSQQVARNSQVTVDTSEFAAEPPYSIATIVQGPTNGWGTIFDVVMNHALEESGMVEDQLYVPWDFTTESQANGIDDAIAKGVDAILLTSLSRAGLAAPVERAAEAGIPVVVCMAGVATDAYTVEVSRHIPDMGYSSAKAMAEELGGEGKVVLLHGIAGVDAAEFWRSRALAALSEYPGIEVLSEQYGNWSVSDATNVMRAVLSSEPEIDAVWVGGLEMGVAVINAFDEAGRDMPFIAGTNPINGFLRLAIEHDIDFVASPFPPSASQKCVETMFQVLAGEPVQKFNDVADLMEGTEPFTDEEAEERYMPQFSDDWIGPAVVPDEVYIEAGFGR